MGADDMGGNWNRILFVDLGSGDIGVECPGDLLYRRYLGGNGLGARVIYSRQAPGVEPLSAENILGFTTGTPVGAPVVGACRFIVCGKSPLTGTWGDANCGGYFGPALKQAGVDAVFFTGAAPRPVVLHVEDGRAEVREASHLWGRGTYETERALKAEYGEEAAVVSIGPAGEKLSRIAGVIHDRGRAAARSGLGAVMGAKRLKAIVACGTLSVPVADEARLRSIRNRCLAELKEDASIPAFRMYGTISHVASSAFSGDSPVKNWAGVAAEQFPTTNAISDDRVLKYEIKSYGCYRCPIACGGIYRVEDGPYAVEATQKPEYETCGMFGNSLLNDNIESIIRANYLCNDYGLDTISTGSTIAFATECFESGLLTKDDTGGLELGWGRHEAIVRLTEMIGRREGIGELLGEGSLRAALQIGGPATEFAIHAGGQEIAAHDPRFAPTFAVNSVADATPGRHTQMGLALVELGARLKGIDVPSLDKHRIEGKGELNARLLDVMQAVYSAGVCAFIYQKLPVTVWPEVLQAVTGWQYTWDELLRTGARVAAIRQAFNVREGISVASVPISDRAIGRPPMRSGPLKGVSIDVETQRRELYKARGWHEETGVPLRETLLRLELDDVAGDLHAS